MRDHLMKSDSMDIDPSCPTRENHSRLSQIRARTLWFKPPNGIGVGKPERAFLFFPPAISSSGGFLLPSPERDEATLEERT